MKTNPIQSTGAFWKVMPWVSRLFLIPPILIFVMISLRFIHDPFHAVAATGVALTTPEAVTDTRVTGGLTLTIALFVGVCAFSKNRLQEGHWLVAVVMLLVLAVRLYGFSVDGTTLAMGTQFIKMRGEVVFLILNLIGLGLETARLKISHGPA